MNSIFALLSGEHPTLPKAEVEAVLEAEGLPYTVLEKSGPILRLQASENACNLIEVRASYCHLCCVELLVCDASPSKILQSAKTVQFDRYLNPGESMVVRVKRIHGSSTDTSIPMLEGMLGESILKQTGDVRVNLENPDKYFAGFLFDERFILGLAPSPPRGKKVWSRTPRRKPFFHPSSLQPKLARCMVNIARAKRGKVLLDPFCGTGTILIEAGLIGVESVGGDIKKRMVEGARVNLNHYKIGNAHLLLSDGLLPPIRRVNFVVTDPPYGRAATTVGTPLSTLMEKFMAKVSGILAAGGYLCVACPKSLDVSSLAKQHGFEAVEKHHVYVHRSLTREIAVFRYA